MFWKKKKKEKAPQKPEDMSREEILAEAKANAAAAREEIGNETLDKIKEAMMRKENSPMEQAKKIIKKMDQDKVRDQLSEWAREKDQTKK